jgi:phosphopantothenoylcysteine decarboxylase/phosphopantothenate--cysteine ligase
VDLVLIAPSTANTIGKVANGIDDTPVTTTVSSAIGAKIPVVVVPAMHESMYDHPAVIENIEKLKSMGIGIVSPRMEEAKAKIPDVDTIVDFILATLGPKDLDGKHFLVSAGPTRGWLDRVRFISNPSTGKMGIALVHELISRGASVTLVLGPTAQVPPAQADVVNVSTYEEMSNAVMKALTDTKTTCFISTAAVLDYIPSKKEDSKLASGKSSLSIDLIPTKKIIEEARKKYKDLFIVGFKVESGISEKELESRAKAKIDAGTCNLVVANDEQKKGVAFESDTNEVLIVGPKGTVEKVPLSSKREVAHHIVDVIAKMIK